MEWYFDLIGPAQDIWVWRRVDYNGIVVGMSEGTFRYYLDCVADARKCGFEGPPRFRAPSPLLRPEGGRRTSRKTH